MKLKVYDEETRKEINICSVINYYKEKWLQYPNLTEWTMADSLNDLHFVTSKRNIETYGDNLKDSYEMGTDFSLLHGKQEK
jgi:hypothetical protein